jgi:hypothetical protein
MTMPSFARTVKEGIPPLPRVTAHGLRRTCISTPLLAALSPIDC